MQAKANVPATEQAETARLAPRRPQSPAQRVPHSCDTTTVKGYATASPVCSLHVACRHAAGASSLSSQRQCKRMASSSPCRWTAGAPAFLRAAQGCTKSHPLMLTTPHAWLLGRAGQGAPGVRSGVGQTHPVVSQMGAGAVLQSYLAAVLRWRPPSRHQTALS